MKSKQDTGYIIAHTKVKARIRKALDIAVKYGGNDGAHHKDWVIDQMVRALTGCPVVVEKGIGYDGKPYQFKCMGENKAYIKLVEDACNGEDGPDTYFWSTGIAP